MLKITTKSLIEFGQARTTAAILLLMKITTSCPNNAKPHVCVQLIWLCDESRSLDGRRGATFTIKPVVCCVALRSRVVNDTTGASVRADRTEKRL
jgi:hypothetical protein